MVQGGWHATARPEKRWLLRFNKRYRSRIQSFSSSLGFEEMQRGPSINYNVTPNESRSTAHSGHALSVGQRNPLGHILDGTAFYDNGLHSAIQSGDRLLNA